LHVPSLASHHALATQSTSEAQLVPQVAPEPVQRYGAQTGLPDDPSGAGPQTPSEGAPSACAHTSHGPSQLAPQQNPSTQPPGLAQARQPETRQSAPAIVLHASPCPFRSLHVPSAAQ
jgi:hypothetical protein